VVIKELEKQNVIPGKGWAVQPGPQRLFRYRSGALHTPWHS